MTISMSGILVGFPVSLDTDVLPLVTHVAMDFLQIVTLLVYLFIDETSPFSLIISSHLVLGFDLFFAVWSDKGEMNKKNLLTVN
jgi:hypothetical protein